EPALSGVRMVATTLPGMAGAPVTAEVSIPAVARRAGELAKDNACDVVGVLLRRHDRIGDGALGTLPRPGCSARDRRDDTGRGRVLPRRRAGVTEGGQVAAGH